MTYETGLPTRSRRFFFSALIGVAFLGAHLTNALATEEEDVDLELVLAVDVSLSMDGNEQDLQRKGYIDAIQHPDVIKAIQEGGYGRIAVTYLEWAGVGAQSQVVDWHIVGDHASAQVFANNLAKAPISRLRRTSISAGLLAAAELFDNNGIRGLRRVIDMSGDGPNNQGKPVADVRDQLIQSGIVINGLPLMLTEPNAMSFFDIENLDQYYEACVVGGYGSFVLPVRHLDQFADAIRQKLILEIASVQPRIMFASDTQPTPAEYDCLVGEKMWLDWMSRGYFDP